MRSPISGLYCSGNRPILQAIGSAEDHRLLSFERYAAWVVNSVTGSVVWNKTRQAPSLQSVVFNFYPA